MIVSNNIDNYTGGYKIFNKERKTKFTHDALSLYGIRMTLLYYIHLSFCRCVEHISTE